MLKDVARWYGRIKEKWFIERNTVEIYLSFIFRSYVRSIKYVARIIFNFISFIFFSSHLNHVLNHRPDHSWQSSTRFTDFHCSRLPLHSLHLFHLFHFSFLFNTHRYLSFIPDYFRFRGYRFRLSLFFRWNRLLSALHQILFRVKSWEFDGWSFFFFFHYEISINDSSILLFSSSIFPFFFFNFLIELNFIIFF